MRLTRRGLFGGVLGLVGVGVLGKRQPIDASQHVAKNIRVHSYHYSWNEGVRQPIVTVESRWIPDGPWIAHRPEVHDG